MRGAGRKTRDFELLDAIDALDRVPFNGSAWRAVREGRDPLQGHPSGGRWDPGVFDVLYTSLAAAGAIAEVQFHLARQPVFPSGIRYHLYEISVRAQKTLRFAELSELERLGVDVEGYTRVGHRRTQEIGDAAYFLGFDGLIAPNARMACLNLVIFTDQVSPEDLEVRSSQLVEWEHSSGAAYRSS